MLAHPRLPYAAGMDAQTNGPATEISPVPSYLSRVYWWAYVHPRAIHFFERQWLVNLILWGNFDRLRDAALGLLGEKLGGRTLQIACVYGNLTRHLVERMEPDGSLDVVDVLPLQLENLRRKLPHGRAVRLLQSDSADLGYESGTFDRALLFFLLHEQPEAVRRATLAEALRVVRPGGRVVVVDYHRPHAFHPLFWPMKGILRSLEPFALDLWKNGIEAWLPADRKVSISRGTLFGGLYQLVTLTPQ